MSSGYDLRGFTGSANGYPAKLICSSSSKHYGGLKMEALGLLAAVILVVVVGVLTIRNVQGR